LGLLAALVAVVWFALIGPFVGGFFDRAEERRSLALQYQRNERIAASMPVWRAMAQAQRLSASRFAIVAPSEELAAESLKERILHLGQDEGFNVAAVQDLQANAAAGTVKVRADLQISLTQLIASLKRLQTEAPYVVVDYVSISADRALATGRSSLLAARLEVSADYKAAGAGPT
jgi:general secretion pathway protein M